MAGRNFSRIGDVLPAVLKSLGLEQRFKEQELLTVWPETAGPDIAAHTRPTRIERGVLYVHVDHGAWMQELHFIEKDLIKKLCERVPGVELKKIRFSSKETP